MIPGARERLPFDLEFRKGCEEVARRFYEILERLDPSDESTWESLGAERQQLYVTAFFQLFDNGAVFLRAFNLANDGVIGRCAN
jgi:hypothetical protein